MPLLAALTVVGAEAVASEGPRDLEFRRLMPFVTEACAVVKDQPAIFPYRSFTFGPRVNDVFLMAGQVREAIPSPTMGAVRHSPCRCRRWR
jgi:hypothetical protein